MKVSVGLFPYLFPLLVVRPVPQGQAAIDKHAAPEKDYRTKHVISKSLACCSKEGASKRPACCSKKIDLKSTSVVPSTVSNDSCLKGTVVVGNTRDNTPELNLNTPMGICIDSKGAIYVVDTYNHRVKKLTTKSTGGYNTETVAGITGKMGTDAIHLNLPRGICVDRLGNLYVADYGNHRIQKFPVGSQEGTHGETIAGGVGKGAAANQLAYPQGIALGRLGALYVADCNNHRIQRFKPNSKQGDDAETVGGTGSAGSLPNQLKNPYDVLFDSSSGNVYVADWGNHRVQRFKSGSKRGDAAETIAGTGIPGLSPSQLNHPIAIGRDVAKNLYVSDSGNHRIQKFPPSSTRGTVGLTVVGCKVKHHANLGYLNTPGTIALSNLDNKLYVIDTKNNSILQFNFPQQLASTPSHIAAYRIDTTSSAICQKGTTILGTLKSGNAIPDQLNNPRGVCVDKNRVVYVADTWNHRIQKLVPTSTGKYTVTTVGGTGFPGNEPNRLNLPSGICLDLAGNLYVADWGNHRIQKFKKNAKSGDAGETVAGGKGDGIAANQLDYPEAVYVDSNKNIYVADCHNHRIQRFPSDSKSGTSGITIAGTGVEGAASNQLKNPYDISFDKSENLYVADWGNHRIQRFKKWSKKGSPGETVAGTGAPGIGTNQLNHPTSVFAASSNLFYVSDCNNQRIQKFLYTPRGKWTEITAAGGNGVGTASNQLRSPRGIYLDVLGNLYVADYENHRIQKFDLYPQLKVTHPDPVCAPNTVNLTNAEITKESMNSRGNNKNLSFTYYNDAAGRTPLVNPSAVSVSGTYYIKATDKMTSCPSSMKPVNVLVLAQPEDVQVHTQGAFLCGSDDAVLDLSNIIKSPNPAYLYTFKKDGVDLPNPPIIDQTGTYEVAVTSKSTHCSSKSSSVLVKQGAIPFIKAPPLKWAYAPYKVNLVAALKDSTLRLVYYEQDQKTQLTHPETVGSAREGVYTYYVQGVSKETGCKSPLEELSVEIKAAPSIIISSTRLFEGESTALKVSFSDGAFLEEDTEVNLFTGLNSTADKRYYSFPKTIKILKGENSATFVVKTKINPVIEREQFTKLVIQGKHKYYPVYPGVVTIGELSTKLLYTQATR